MSMPEFRLLAAKIDQHMQRLAAQGISEAHAIINRRRKSVFDMPKRLGVVSKGPGAHCPPSR
jgi:hypothetical protein